MIMWLAESSLGPGSEAGSPISHTHELVHSSGHNGIALHANVFDENYICLHHPFHST